MQRYFGLPGGRVVCSPSRHYPRFLKARGEGADVRRGVFSCGNLKQSSRGVVLVQYTYGDGILTRVVARRRPEGICRYLPLLMSVQPMEHKGMLVSIISGQRRSPCSKSNAVDTTVPVVLNMIHVRQRRNCADASGWHSSVIFRAVWARTRKKQSKSEPVTSAFFIPNP